MSKLNIKVIMKNKFPCQLFKASYTICLLLALVVNVSSASAQSTLLAGWDFQTTSNGGTAAAVAPNSPTVYNANFGSGTIYLNGTNGSSVWVTATSGNQVTSFAGTAVNTTGTSFATTTTSPACLALLNSTANGKSIVFAFNMTSKANLVVSYATQGTASGFTTQQWDYSTNGTTWTAAQTIGGIPTSFATKTLTTITGLDNATTAYLRLTVTGASASAGNNRLDNIQLSASSSMPPVVANDTAYGVFGVPFNRSIVATGNPTSYMLSGQPSWMTFNTTTGVMTGTPDAALIYPITIDAFNAVGSGTGSTVVIIDKAPQTISFGPLNSVNYGAPPITLTATGGASGNAITYSNSNPTVASISGNTVTILGVGITNITASQLGNANYYAASNVSQTLIVNQAPQVISFGALTSKLSNDPPFSLTATGGGSSNPIVYSSSNPAVADVVGNTVTIYSAGTTTITANQAGDANYLPASPVSQTLVVNSAALLPQSISFSALSNGTYGGVSITLSASGGGSGNPIVYASSDPLVATISGNTLTIVAPGTTTITATQAGNATYAPANPVTQTFTVDPKPLTVPTAVAQNKMYDGNANAVINGLVLLGIVGTDNVTVSGTGLFASVNAGTGIGVTPNLVLGGVDANKYLLIQPSNLSADILQASQTISFAALPAKTYGNAAYTLTAMGGGSGNPITYTSSNTNVLTITGNTVTIVGAGSADITASQAGNGNYLAAVDVMQTQLVNKANQTITFAALPSKAIGDPAFALVATSSSGLAVSFSSSNSAVASLSTNTVTVVGVGTTTLTASQSGNNNYNAANDVARVLTVTYPLIAAWDFFGQSSPATVAATAFNSALVSTGNLNLITRGATAVSNTAANSFRTTGFQNNGISTSNTDYFQTTLKASPGNSLSLSSINANFAGTASFAAAPGVTQQFAYSLNGSTFTLIGSPFVTTGTPASSPLIDLTGIPALQNIHSSVTVTLRYYASGQTTSGGWGFNSTASGINGLAFGGTVSPCTPVTNTQSITLCVANLPYAWNGQTINASGTYTHTAITQGGCDSTEILNVTVSPCNTNLIGKCYIQGFYLGGNMMQPALSNGGITAPFTACDSIDIELRDSTSPNLIVASGKTLLNQDGSFSYSFPSLNGFYYLVIKHRSALQTWSASPILFSGTSVQYDFTTAANKAYGDNMIELEPGKWAFYSGDVVVDENMDLLDLGMVESDISNFSYGYLVTDINGDGNVDLLDSPILEGNISNFIYSVHP